jgi:hypothetical protein
MDDNGAWKHALARELRAAGHVVDWNKVIALIPLLMAQREDLGNLSTRQPMGSSLRFIALPL